MSILGKIVGQLENVGDGGSSGGSSGMNYINTEVYPVVKTGQYYTGIVIAKLAEDNKLYKFDVVITVDEPAGPKHYQAYAYGFTYNKQVFVMNFQRPESEFACLFTKDNDTDNQRLLIGLGDTAGLTIQVEGYTTLTPEEVVYELPSTQSEIKASTYLFNRLESLETRVAALESA